MTKEEFAAKLDGREYGCEMTDAESAQAKASGLLVVFGASDDLVEFRGVLHDEAGASNGGTVLIGVDGTLLPEDIDSYEEEVLEKYGMLNQVRYLQKQALRIEAKWCPPDHKTSWRMETSAPHARFNIMEDGEVFCQGIVLEVCK